MFASRGQCCGRQRPVPPVVQLWRTKQPGWGGQLSRPCARHVVRGVEQEERGRVGQAPARRAALKPLVQEAPDCDPDLLAVLELATDEELEELHRLLHGRSLLSPLVKSIIAEHAEPAALETRGRNDTLRRLDQRLRFLAADSAATLRGRWPSYREILLQLRDTLGVRCASTLATPDLETEVFLAVLTQHSDAVGVQSEAAASAAAEAAFADGMSGGASGGEDPSLLQRLLAPLRLGREEVLPVLAKLGSATAVTRLTQSVVQRLGGRLVTRHVQYEAAFQLLLTAGSKGMAASLETRVAVQAAQRGLTGAAAKYAGARSVLSMLGPLLWASTALDLALLSIGSDHQRVLKAVFALAQIRLLRTHGFSSSPDGRL